MVKDLIKIKPKALKQAQKIYQALDLLGITQDDLLNIKKTNEQITLLTEKVNELEHWKKIKIREENERLASYKKKTNTNAQNEYEAYVNDKGVEFNPYAQ